MANPIENTASGILQRRLVSLALLALVACSAKASDEDDWAAEAGPSAEAELSSVEDITDAELAALEEEGLRAVEPSELEALAAEGARAAVTDAVPLQDSALIKKADWEFWLPKARGYPINYDNGSTLHYCQSKGFGSVLYDTSRFIRQTEIAAKWNSGSNKWILVVGRPPYMGDRFIVESLACRPPFEG